MSQIQGRETLEARARKIVEALSGTWSRSRGMCCCPAHADRTPSLSITLGKRAILVHCFAGCTNEAVMQGMAKLGCESRTCSTGRAARSHPRRVTKSLTATR
jgi:putative DNA primase/helicase